MLDINENRRGLIYCCGGKHFLSSLSVCVLLRKKWKWQNQAQNDSNIWWGQTNEYNFISCLLPEVPPMFSSIYCFKHELFHCKCPNHMIVEPTVTHPDGSTIICFGHLQYYHIKSVSWGDTAYPPDNRIIILCQA